MNCKDCKKHHNLTHRIFCVAGKYDMIIYGYVEVECSQDECEAFAAIKPQSTVAEQMEEAIVEQKRRGRPKSA